MLRIVLDEKNKSLEAIIRDLLLYSEVSEKIIEVGPVQTHFGDNVLFIDTSNEKCRSQEDVIARIALSLYDFKIHTNGFQGPSKLWLVSKYPDDEAWKIATVVERAIHPDVFFSLERFAAI